MSNGTTRVTRVTLDLGQSDYEALEILVQQLEAPTKADALRRAVRRCVAINRLGPDPHPETLTAILTL